MLGRDYLNWLYFTFGVKEAYDITLFEVLANIEYRYQNNLDRSRMCDGLRLRSDFAYEIGVYESDVADGPCTVLEMLCALGKEMYIQCSQESPSHFVYEMINNLGINRMFMAYEIENACIRWMNNEFEPDGQGSIFYIPGVNDDMRTWTIWEQMSVYLTTFYPDEENIF